jgi:hypothetical protein
VVATHLALGNGLSPAEVEVGFSMFTGSPTSRDEGCPRAAYLVLCHAGLIGGISCYQRAARSRKAEYAIRACLILRSEPGLVSDKGCFGEQHLAEASISPRPDGYCACSWDEGPSDVEGRISGAYSA